MNVFTSAGIARNLFVATFISLMLALTGCVSSGGGTSSYGGSSLSSATAKRASARANVKKARKELRASKKALKKINRRMARDTRKLKRKRISKKLRKKLVKRVKANKRKLRSAKRKVSKAKRRLARARNAEKRATRAIASAKRRKADAERRLAAVERRKAAAEKKKEQLLAQNEAKRDKPVSSSASRLFSLSDPALKNVSDYAARVDGAFPVAAIPVSKMNKRLFRQEVRYSSRHKPGTLVVDPNAKYLYLIQAGGTAMRYGIGVGKAGFEWSGEAHIGWKQEWPKWTPPAEMIERRPDLEKYSADNGGMPGGPANPLGARALYLMQGGVDTLYRLHGTPQWASIGTAASSGCIRLMNQDIIDLYKRVPNGARVVVL
ncbi:MAG: L,D-transpeptidase family protein [Rhizobiaceae bacterium]